MTWKNIVAAATLAGSIIAGGAAAHGNAGRPVNIPASSNSSYFQSYVEDLEHKYGNLLSREESPKSRGGYSYYDAYKAYVSAVLAEHERYMAAVTGMHMESGHKQKIYHLVPGILASGGIQYMDRNNGGYMKAVRYANGEYGYTGTEDVIQRLLGRSELDRVGPKMKNGIFSDD